MNKYNKHSFLTNIIGFIPTDVDFETRIRRNGEEYSREEMSLERNIKHSLHCFINNFVMPLIGVVVAQPQTLMELYEKVPFLKMINQFHGYISHR